MTGKHDNHGKFSSLGEMFFNCLPAYENKIFQYLDDTNEVTTFSEILSLSIRTAIHLKKKGFTRRDIISTCSKNQKHSPLPLIASQFLGAVCTNFHPQVSHLDTIHLLKLIQPKILFVDEESVDFMENCLQKANVSTELVVFGHSEKYSQFSEYLEPNEDEKTFKPVKILDDSETALILFSSGTTGMPKGICLSHKPLLNVSDECVCYDEQTIILLHSTLYWISGVFILIKTALRGHSCVIRINFDPVRTWKIIEKYKITSMFLPPYYAIDFLKQNPKNTDISSLEYLQLGGTGAPVKLFSDLLETLPNVKITIGYAQTEAAGLIALFDVTIPEEYKLQMLKPLSCGKMRKGMTWKVVDVDTEKILGSHEEGELRLKQDRYLMNGYYKMDSSPAFDSHGYLKTGDTVYYDEEECFYIVGRSKEILKYRGWHVIPAILEEILMSHSAVKEAVIIGIPHEDDGEHPMALVVLHDGYTNVILDDIENFVNKRVSDSQKLRAGVKIIDSVPKTATGKIRRNVLKQQILEKIGK